MKDVYSVFFPANEAHNVVVCWDMGSQMTEDNEELNLLIHFRDKGSMDMVRNVVELMETTGTIHDICVTRREQHETESVVVFKTTLAFEQHMYQEKNSLSLLTQNYEIRIVRKPVPNQFGLLLIPDKI